MSRRPLKFFISLTLIFICFVDQLYSQAGYLDTTFNPIVNYFGVGTGANGIVYSSAVQSDNKILIGGSFDTINGAPVYGLARLNEDGTIDTTFKPANFPGQRVKLICLQPSGNILICNSVTDSATTIQNVMSLLPDGSVDPFFSPVSIPTSSVSAMAVESNGNILLGGSFYIAHNLDTIRYLVQLTSNGLLDTTFNPRFKTNYNSVYSIVLQSDQKILVGGNLEEINGRTIKNAIRLNTDASLDTTFNITSVLTGTVYAMAVEPDGKVIIAGEIETLYNGVYCRGIVRYSANGAADPGFNAGYGIDSLLEFFGDPISYVNGLALQADGKIILTGYFIRYNDKIANYLARIDSNGAPDLTFLDNLGSGANNETFTAQVLSDGTIIVGGSLDSCSGRATGSFVHLSPEGLVDTSTIGTNGLVRSTALQSNGQIIICGDFAQLDGMDVNRIARVDASGIIDNSFNVGSGADSSVNTAVIKSDGSILIGGTFSYYNGTLRKGIAELNSNGTLNTSFNPVLSGHIKVNTIALQSDSEIIVGGAFDSVNGTGLSCIARLFSDGSVDPSFNPGTGVTGAGSYFVLASVIRSDGKIVIGGLFDHYNGTAVNGIARLNTNGTIDASFNTGSGIGGISGPFINSLAIQPDGKIIIGGQFNSYNGLSAYNIARLNLDGSLDTTFHQGSGINNAVMATGLMSDGKIIVGGAFTFFNGVSANHIARLNEDGTMDMDFRPGSGTDSNIYSLAFQSNGEIVLGGNFLLYNGVRKDALARIMNNTIDINPLANLTYCAGEGFQLYYHVTGSYNQGNVFTTQLSDSAGNFTSSAIIGSLPSEISGIMDDTIPFSSSPGTHYVLRVISSNPVDTGSIYVDSITINQAPAPVICLVSVDTISNGNIVVWEKPATNLIDSFFIYREITTNNYARIGAVAYGSLNDYYDYGVNPNSTSFKYKVSILDICGDETALSGFQGTIFLQFLASDTILWEHYAIENQNNPVSYYQLYRDDIGNGNFNLLNSSIPGSATTWPINNTEAYPDARYFLEANWGNTCSPVSASRSNITQTITAIRHVNETTQNLLVSPNPANGLVRILWPRSIALSAIKIRNLMGQVVYFQNCNETETGSNEKHISTDGFAKGIYTISGETDSGEITTKLVIQ